MRSNKILSGRLCSSKWRREKQSCNSRTCPRDRTGNTSHRKLTKTLISTLKTKLDPFKNVVSLPNKTFFRFEFKLLNKDFDKDLPTLPKQYNKQTLDKDIVRFSLFL